MSDIHSCSYYCTRPACVLQQRNELRDKLHAHQAEPVDKWLTDDLPQVDKEQAEPVVWDPQCPLCGGSRPAALAQQAEPVDKALTKPAPQVDKEQAEPVVDRMNTNQGEAK
jgi:hypothetical protein